VSQCLGLGLRLRPIREWSRGLVERLAHKAGANVGRREAFCVPDRHLDSLKAANTTSSRSSRARLNQTLSAKAGCSSPFGKAIAARNVSNAWQSPNASARRLATNRPLRPFGSLACKINLVTCSQFHATIAPESMTRRRVESSSKTNATCPRRGSNATTRSAYGLLNTSTPDGHGGSP
jgi:hypothetical protein